MTTNNDTDMDTDMERAVRHLKETNESWVPLESIPPDARWCDAPACNNRPTWANLKTRVSVRELEDRGFTSTLRGVACDQHHREALARGARLLDELLADVPASARLKMVEPHEEVTYVDGEAPHAHGDAEED